MWKTAENAKKNNIGHTACLKKIITLLETQNEPVVPGNIHIEDFQMISQLTIYFCKSPKVL
jgi:hypothetical protein